MKINAMLQIALPTISGSLSALLLAFGINASPAEFLAGVFLGIFGNVAIQSIIEKENRRGYTTIVTSFIFAVFIAASIKSTIQVGFLLRIHMAVFIGAVGASSTLLIEYVPGLIKKAMNKIGKILGGK